MKRRFNGAERIALYLLADGKCENCGIDLIDWHADHIVPFSKGGPTDVINGAALCAPCNLRKGNKLVEPIRPWQQDALNELSLHRPVDFLAVATPGAGKTRFALEAMKADSSFYTVVVPSIQLRRQWADKAIQFGFDLDPRFENGDIRPGKDRHGVVVTYAAVAKHPEIYRNLCRDKRSFVVLDEIHHCGEDASWGKSIQEAFELATRRLLMSGTPFRKDNAIIPFVTYEGNPLQSQANFNYSYGEAITDGVVRSIEFKFWDGTARWMSAGEMISAGLSEVNREDEGSALRSALVPDSEWMNAMLPKAHQELLRIRRDIPNAGGLLIAKKQDHAIKLAKRLESLTGQTVHVAVSDDVYARDKIEKFTTSSDPWLVAVKMVSEGIDIPRLMVGVYATTTLSDLFFRQAVGRFVRVQGDESDSHPATIFMPKVGQLLHLAKTVEDELNHKLKESKEPKEPSNVSSQRSFDLEEPLGAIDGYSAGSIWRGIHIDDAIRLQAAAVIEDLGLSCSPVQLSIAWQRRGNNVIPVESKPSPSQAPWRDRDRLRSDVNRLVNTYFYRSGQSKSRKDIHTALNQAVGEKAIRDCTIGSLNERLSLLSEWISEWPL